MSQESYINAKVDYMNIEQGGRSSKTELTDKEKIIVRGSMGMFRWVTDQTPPDLAFDNLLMSILQSQATFEEVKYINQMVKKLKDINYSIKFVKLERTQF